MTRRRTRFAAILLASLLCSGTGCARSTETDPAATIGAPVADLRLVFAEHTNGTTTFWSARPEEPADRRQLASVRHDPEWGIRASLSPSGDRIAYTVMPSGAADPDGGAALMLLDLSGKTSHRVAAGLDLRTVPVWTGEDRVVVQRRGPIGAGVLVEVSANGDERPLLAADAGRRLFPIGVHPDGRLLVADLGSGEARLRAVERGGAVHDLGPIADGPARGFVLAPDGGTLAFLRLVQRNGENHYQAHVVNLESGDVRPLRTDRPRTEDTGVTWIGDGFAISAVDGETGILLGVTPDRDQTRSSGFDAAAAGSPDGRWTAVRAFERGSPNAPGPERLQLVSADGRRISVVTDGGVTVLGWTDA